MDAKECFMHQRDGLKGCFTRINVLKNPVSFVSFYPATPGDIFISYRVHHHTASSPLSTLICGHASLHDRHLCVERAGRQQDSVNSDQEITHGIDGPVCVDTDQRIVVISDILSAPLRPTLLCFCFFSSPLSTTSFSRRSHWKRTLFARE